MIKEYTLFSVVSVVATIVIDNLTKIRLLRQPGFYFFLLVILGFKFIVNGYLTGTSIVMYNEGFFLGFRIGSIPLEDFLFGFSMVTQTIIFWEYFLRKKKR